MPIYHDPREMIRGIQQLLSSPAKRLGFFTGTGTSMAIINPVSSGPIIPGIVDMTREVKDSLSGDLKNAFERIEEELLADGKPVTIETVLSLVRLKAQVVGNESLCGLDKPGFERLEKKIETEIL